MEILGAGFGEEMAREKAGGFELGRGASIGQGFGSGSRQGDFGAGLQRDFGAGCSGV